MVDHNNNFDDEDTKPPDDGGKWYEFDCPECNANNPMDDGFKVGAEIICHYCGQEFKVAERGSSYKLKIP